MEALEPKEQGCMNATLITRLKRYHLTRRCKGKGHRVNQIDPVPLGWCLAL
jgi:hypothetical protein